MAKKTKEKSAEPKAGTIVPVKKLGRVVEMLDDLPGKQAEIVAKHGQQAYDDAVAGKFGPIKLGFLLNMGVLLQSPKKLPERRAARRAKIEETRKGVEAAKAAKEKAGKK